MKLLILSSYFGQSGVPSSHHIDDRVVELIKHNIDITIITEKKPNYLDIEIINKLDIHAIGTVESSLSRIIKMFKNVGLIKKVINKLEYLVRVYLSKVGFKKDRFADWAWEKHTTDFVLKNIDISHYDLIYSTGGPAVVHLVANNLLRNYKKKWIAEIQDPLIFDEIQGPSYQATKNDLNKLALVERSLRESDALICLTQECSNHYKRKLVKEEVYHIYPGSDIGNVKIKEIEKNPIDGNKITFFHAGSLAAERNLDTFIEVVIGLNIQERIRLKLAGYVDANIKKVIQQYSSFIEYLGIISRGEVKANIIDSDVCLVIQNFGPISKYTVPSKFYEYMALGTSTLFLGYKNKEMEVNSKIYNFYYADQSSKEIVKEVLTDIVENFGKNRKVAIPLDIKDSTNKFLKICNDLC